MLVAITGHTSGLGLAVSNYFSSRATVLGFSRRTGYDISKPEDRERIVQASLDADIFVNNAFNDYDHSQTLMLREMFNAWSNHDRLIINISSRWTQQANPYCANKLEQDRFCESVIFQKPKIINLKPGLVDTPRVTQIPGSRMNTDCVVAILDFILSTRQTYGISSITFGV